MKMWSKSEEFPKFATQQINLQKQLKQEFPELDKLSSESRKKVIEKAIAIITANQPIK